MNALMFGQSKAEEPVKVVTVCDILLNPSEFEGKVVAVLGLSAATDEGSWLIENDCGRKVEVKVARDGSIWLERRASLTQFASRMPLIDQDSLNAKLIQISKTTKLGRSPQYECRISVIDNQAIVGKSQCGWQEHDDHWAIAYGKIEATGRGEGFGHLGGSPAQVLVKASTWIDQAGHLKR